MYIHLAQTSSRCCWLKAYKAACTLGDGKFSVAPADAPLWCPPQPGLDTLRRHDPDAAAAVGRALAQPPHELAQLMRLEGMDPSGGASGAACADVAGGHPAGGDGGGGGEAGRRYAAAAAARLLVDDVAWQFDALSRGFWSGALQEVRGKSLR